MFYGFPKGDPFRTIHNTQLGHSQHPTAQILRFLSHGLSFCRCNPLRGVEGKPRCAAPEPTCPFWKGWHWQMRTKVTPVPSIFSQADLSRPMLQNCPETKSWAVQTWRRCIAELRVFDLQGTLTSRKGQGCMFCKIPPPTKGKKRKKEEPANMIQRRSLTCI